ncbi:MAG: ABC transporter ATP-binding protein [Balneolaceae bacterium]
MISLSVHNLGKNYGQNIVFRNLSFTLPSQVTGIAGNNGSGKSTLLRCLAGLLKPTGGRVTWYRDKNEIAFKKLNQTLGFAAPYVELYEGLSSRENLQFLLDLKKDQQNPPDLHRHLQRFDAAELSNKKYGELSTGQRQRIKLAASCLHQPSILCLDEPGTNLDPRGKILVRETIEQFKQEGKMVLLASNLEEEIRLCDHVINLDRLNNPYE